jgi:S-adenosylmethionine-dependent methyltransferase
MTDSTTLPSETGGSSLATPDVPVRDEAAVIEALYDGDPEREWQRMNRHPTEFAVTLKGLSEYLPPPPARILDCGGGPGRYTIELARRGYTVTLFDLSSELIQVAKQRAAEAQVNVEAFEQGTATDLGRFPDAAFDGVLLMGPLYHLLEEHNRRQALAEAYRVLRPGGTLFAAFISRYAGHIDAAAHYPEQAPTKPHLYRRIAETGLLPPRSGDRLGFVAYFARPDELAPLCRSVGLDVVTVLGVEGVTSGHGDRVNALTGEAWEYWVDVNYQIAQEPSMLGASEHMLVVASRPRWRAALRHIGIELKAHGVAYHLVGTASLALRGLPVQVHDLDLEMDVGDAARFQELFSAQVRLPIAWRQSPDVRSYFGQFEIEGVSVEVIASLEWRAVGGDRWIPSFLSTHAVVDLEGVPIPVLELEEEALAALRRGRLDRAGQILPHADAARFLALLAQIQAKGGF